MLLSYTYVPTLVVAAAALLVTLPAGGRAQLMEGDPELGHPLQNKRSFLGLQCRGVFDKVTFHELNAVCKECYGLYQEPELHGLCRSECFTTEYFKGCLQALRRAHETDKFDMAIRRISGK
ncbi:ion transport peptide-like [Amphibalanus amphitrite]|uniref:ion transport peptide-like n=1 Tax=Amphibalanus amphitrite TaxID=1232801 RepID=UPI001C91D189|nr:ion transport peptide-like [Amphibalanus amphitrite]